MDPKKLPPLTEAEITEIYVNLGCAPEYDDLLDRLCAQAKRYPAMVEALEVYAKHCSRAWAEGSKLVRCGKIATHVDDGEFKCEEHKSVSANRLTDRYPCFYANVALKGETPQ